MAYNGDLFAAFPGAGRENNDFIPPPPGATPAAYVLLPTSTLPLLPRQAQSSALATVLTPPTYSPWSASVPQNPSGWPAPALGPSAPSSPWPASASFAPPSPWQTPSFAPPPPLAAYPAFTPPPNSAPAWFTPTPTVWDMPPLVSPPPLTHSISTPHPSWFGPPAPSPFLRPASAGPRLEEPLWANHTSPSPTFAPPPAAAAYPAFFPLQRSVTGPRKPNIGTDTFSESNLAKRPRDWRPEYTAPSQRFKLTLSSFRPRSLSRSRTRAESFSSRGKPSPYINAKDPNCISYDLRTAPTHLPPIVLYQLAFQPPLRNLSLTHPLLPHPINITASTPSGITVLDLLSQIYEELQIPIRQGEFFTDALGSKEREELGRSATVRCNGDLAQLNRGIMRVDFLGNEFVFAGLERVWGRWEFKTRQG